MITIYCLDKTHGLLFFAHELFDILLNAGMKLVVKPNESRNTDYGSYFSFFSGLSVTREKTPDHKFAAAIIVTESVHLPVPAPFGLPTLVIPFLTNRTERERSILELIQDSKRTAVRVNCRSDRGMRCIPQATDCFDLLQLLLTKQDLKGIRVLVSAGPTAEDLDPVRFLTNRSSGKMGIAMAKAAFLRGAQVKLVIGPTSERIPSYLDVIHVRSAGDMAEAILSRFSACDLYYGSAAVADFTPEEVAREKIKKKKDSLILKLKRTVDILETVKDIRSPQQSIVGFSVETSHELENSMAKMHRKKLDMIVINNPKEKDAGFAVETNKVTIIGSGNDPVTLPVMTKFEVANRILDHTMQMRAERNVG